MESAIKAYATHALENTGVIDGRGRGGGGEMVMKNWKLQYKEMERRRKKRRK